VVCPPTVCPNCGCEDFEDVHDKNIHQFIDLVENLIEITHFIIQEGTCSTCGRLVSGKVPKEYIQSFGANFHALLAWLSTEGGVTRRHLSEFSSDFLGVPISQGALQNILRRISEAIEDHYNLIAEGARNHWYNHMDETSAPTFGPMGKHTHWLWVMCNERFALFKIEEHRSKEAFNIVIGPWRGILISDDYGTYIKWKRGRQTCLSHLIRAARRVSEFREEKLAKCGKWLLGFLKSLRKKKGERWSAEQIAKLKSDFLNKAKEFDDKLGGEARTLLDRLMNEFDAVVFFLTQPVEPTNNFAERTIRSYVVARKNSFGVTSEWGEKWLERTLSLRMTCKLQNVPYAQVLKDAFTHRLKGTKPDLSWLKSNTQEKA